MSTSGWRTSLVVQGLAVGGHTVPVVVGLLETADGAVHMALRVGETGAPVMLYVQVAELLAANIRETVAERLKITGENIGDDGQ